MKNLLLAHGEKHSASFDSWAAEVHENPELIRPSEAEAREHSDNAYAAAEAVRNQPQRQAQRLKEIAAIRRKAKKFAWLYD